MVYAESTATLLMFSMRIFFADELNCFPRARISSKALQTHPDFTAGIRKYEFDANYNINSAIVKFNLHAALKCFSTSVSEELKILHLLIMNTLSRSSFELAGTPAFIIAALLLLFPKAFPPSFCICFSRK